MADLFTCPRCFEDTESVNLVFSKKKLWGCKFCWNKYQKNWRDNNRERFKEIKRKSLDKHVDTTRNYELLKSKGISLEEYNNILISQNNVCAICNTTDTRTYKDNRRGQILPLFVDHNHQTGEVRGLLCNKCNAGLGMFRDNPEYLASAISYLKE